MTENLDFLNSTHTVPLFFEVPPARLDATEEGLRKNLSRLDRLFQAVPYINAINIPEINDEHRAGNRVFTFYPREEPRVYGRRIMNEFGKTVIVNQVVVRQTEEAFQAWALKTWQEFGIRHLILVGGESSRVRYPGPSVTQANHLVQDYLNKGVQVTSRGLVEAGVKTEFSVGNITIPGRVGEVGRVALKVGSGTRFFTSQVLYEAETTKRLLKGLELVFAGKGAPLIFLTLVPIADRKDIAFLRWLGIDFPQETEQMLTRQGSLSDNSIGYALYLWDHIVRYVTEEKIHIPLGVNVEYISKRNFGAAIELAQEVQKRLLSYREVEWVTSAALEREENQGQ